MTLSARVPLQRDGRACFGSGRRRVRDSLGKRLTQMPAMSFERRLPGVRLLEQDVCKLSGSELASVDVLAAMVSLSELLTGGRPCVNFEDERAEHCSSRYSRLS